MNIGLCLEGKSDYSLKMHYNDENGLKWNGNAESWAYKHSSHLECVLNTGWKKTLSQTWVEVSIETTWGEGTVLKTSWKGPKLKWPCIQMGIVTLKEQTITTDKQLGISGKQQAETEELPWNMAQISRQAKREPSPLTRTGSSPGGGPRCYTADRLDRCRAGKPFSLFEMPEHPGCQPCCVGIPRVRHSDRWITKGMKLSDSKGFKPLWLSTYWSHFTTIRLFPEPLTLKHHILCQHSSGSWILRGGWRNRCFTATVLIIRGKGFFLSQRTLAVHKKKKVNSLIT